MKSLEVTRFLGFTTGVFFRPFKTLTDVYAAIGEIGRRNSFRLALTAFLIGNVSMTLAGILMSASGMWEGAGFLLLHLAFRLLTSLVSNIVLIAFFYLLIFIFSREDTVLPQIDKLICLYFVPDILFTSLLPVSLLLCSFVDVTGTIYRIFAAVVTVFVLLMKIKALSVIASISKGKSTALFLAPILISAVFVVLCAAYAAVFLSRMFS